MKCRLAAEQREPINQDQQNLKEAHAARPVRTRRVQ
jgi:hypothetical protein